MSRHPSASLEMGLVSSIIRQEDEIQKSLERSVQERKVEWPETKLEKSR